MRPTRPERTCLLIRAHKRACSAAYYPNPPQRRLRTFQVIPHSRENIKNIFLTPPRALLAALSTISALIAFRAQLALGTSPPLRSVDYCFAILPDSGRPGCEQKKKPPRGVISFFVSHVLATRARFGYEPLLRRCALSIIALQFSRTLVVRGRVTKEKRLPIW